MKRILILLLFLSNIFFCCAVNLAKVDSLHKLLQKCAEDSNKVNLYFQIARQYDLYSSKEHITNYVMGLNLAKKLSFVNGCKKMYVPLVVLFFYKNMYEESLAYAIEFLDFCDKNDLPNEKVKVYSMMGNLYTKQGNLKEGMKFYELKKDWDLKKGNQAGYASTMNNMAINYLDGGQLDSSIACSNRAITIFIEKKMVSEAANSILGLAEIFVKKKEYGKAMEHADEAMEKYLSINLGHGVSNAKYVKAGILMEMGRNKEARNELNSSLKLADSLNLLSVKTACYYSLSVISARENKFAEAYDYHVLWKSWEDSLALGNQKEKMMEIEGKAELSKAEGQLKVKEAEVLDKQKQRNISFAALAGLALLLFVSYRAYSLKKRSNVLISEQKSLVEKKNHEITDSITYAKRLQEAILPSRNAVLKYFPESFLLYQPKDIVAGDFYWMEHVNSAKDSESILIAAADSTGHGVPGAMVSVVCCNALNRSVKEFGLVKTGEVLDKTRDLVLETFAKSNEEVKDGMDISLLSIDLVKKEISWSGANNQLWYISKGELKEITADKQPIGRTEHPKPFTTHAIPYTTGDIFYLMTDGYPDQFGGPKGKKFKYKQLQELLLSIYTEKPESQSHILTQRLNAWKGDLEQVDDVCIIGIKV